MSLYPLSLGSITFDQGPFESPDGNKGGLTDLGIKQKSVVREFPGGIISAQLYGAFPKNITWSGRLYGVYALNRCFELRNLAEGGRRTTFQWAQWTFYQSRIQSKTVSLYPLTLRRSSIDTKFGD